MLWDYAETFPLDRNTGTFLNAVEWVSEVIEPLGRGGPAASTEQADATGLETQSEPIVISTDPPYYDNIGYADLSDYFYVWLRRSLREFYPELLSTLITPKSDEMIATPYRHSGSKSDAESFFRKRFISSFRSMADIQSPEIPMTLFYAFKQTESSESLSGTYSTGWASMLEAMLGAGWSVTANMADAHRDASNRMIAAGTNSLGFVNRPQRAV